MAAKSKYSKTTGYAPHRGKSGGDVKLPTHGSSVSGGSGPMHHPTAAVPKTAPQNHGTYSECPNVPGLVKPKG